MTAAVYFYSEPAAADCSNFFLCRLLRGSPFQKVRQTPGFTRGHNNDAPSEQLSPNKSLTELFYHADPRRKDTLILINLRNFSVNICGKERSKEKIYIECIQCLRIRDSGWHYYDPRWNRGLWGSIGIESPLGGDTIFCLFRRLRGSEFQYFLITPVSPGVIIVSSAIADSEDLMHPI